MRHGARPILRVAAVLLLLAGSTGCLGLRGTPPDGFVEVILTKRSASRDNFSSIATTVALVQIRADDGRIFQHGPEPQIAVDFIALEDDLDGVSVMHTNLSMIEWAGFDRVGVTITPFTPLDEEGNETVVYTYNQFVFAEVPFRVDPQMLTRVFLDVRIRHEDETGRDFLEGDPNGTSYEIQRIKP